ncbi:ABC transporter permease/M1 family aminopeptidase [Gracilimonas mengyeensis]|uniref:ABC-2 family transporter protein n=1 Tax=Gracilimonas mengyeensis TaxID=1302730 RepID=A0A521ESN8_9BACT|nr:M1 family aminopeptidase [Gracilimonas mengyeensis]SMO86927.1 ABC-2 family transporter protein [Gracilimonas mengyeensis]
MITALLKFEIQYQRKLWALPAAMILFFLTGLQVGGQAFAPDMVDFNAPYQISYYISIFTLGDVFAIMFFVINGILRDRDHHMEEIVFSTGVQKHQFFISRFGGVFLFSLLAVSPLVLGMMAGHLLFDLDPERLATFSLFPYFWNWLVFVFPNVLICSAFIFSVGLLTKNRMAVYSSAVMVYVLYFVCSFFFNSPILADSAPTHTDNMRLAALGDPFGISAFMEQSQYLKPLQKNEVLVSLTGNFLLNRLLWITLSFVMLGIAYRLFSFRALQQRNQKSFSDKETLRKDVSPNAAYQPVVPSTHSGRIFWQGFLSQTNMGLKQLLKSLPFQAMMVLVAFIISSEFYTTLMGGGSYSESLYPVTSLLAGMNNTAIFIFGLLLIVFYSGEWAWKERSEQFHLILDATPSSNASFFWSKVSVLLCIPFLFISLEIIIAIAFQMLLDYPRIDPGTYLSLYYFQGIPLVFYLLLGLFIQSLSSGKYLGMAITGLVVAVFGTPLSGKLGIEHQLLQIGAMPSVTFSDMSGVSNSASSFYLLSTHWLFLGLILSLLALHVWRRGITESFGIHLKQLFRGWTVKKTTVLVVLGLGFLGTSGMIFYKTNIETEYLYSEERLDRWADYEKKYKHYDEEPWLYPVSIKTDVALYPEERSYAVDATYVLKNKSDSVVSRALIIQKKPMTNLRLEKAQLIAQNSDLGLFEFRFESPVLPGDTVTLAFTADGSHKGLQSGRDLVDNGSFVHMRDFSPYLGYTDDLEISDNTEREKRGLPKRAFEQPSAADFDVMESGFGRVDFETILSVPDSQTGISIGHLEEQWTENGRHYYHYKAQKPVAPAITYHSAEYAIEHENYKGINLEHYYHAKHTFNNQTTMESMRQTLDYAQQEFGKYRLDHLRVVEIPSYWRFGGYAAAGTISMVEDNFYLVDERAPEVFNLVTKRTIHEVAHQWWGHMLSTQSISGGAIFVEGFAKYTEAVVMEKHYGMSSLFQLGKSANHTYFNGRSYASTPEQPLYLEQGEHYMLYGKSYMVMLALKELIGEKSLNQVLKTLVTHHQHETDATVTSREFLDELYKITPEKHHSLVDDWFKKIITYDLSVNNVEYEQLADGRYKLQITINAAKFEAVNGVELPVSMQEPIPIGLFTEHPSEASREQIILLESRTIRDGKQQLSFKVDSLPQFVSIDPYGTRPDLVRMDNLIKVE